MHYYPPFGLVLQSGDLTLRVVEDSDLAHLTAVREGDIFSPNCPWVFPWLHDDFLPLSVAQFHWGLRANNMPDDWTLSFAVYLGPEFCGSIDIRSKNFSTTRTIDTGSYVLRTHQGQGVGTHVRQMVATYCFEYLGATAMTTAWHPLNEASAAVSKKLGYLVQPCERPLVCARLLQEGFAPLVALQVAGHTVELEQFLGVRD